MSGAERLFWYAFLFFIPFQARTVIEQTGGGWRFIEWRSVSLFGTDILILGLLLFWLLAIIQRRSGFHWFKSDWFLVGFMLVAGASIPGALNEKIGLYSWIKLLEFGLLFLFIRSYALKTFPLRHSLWAFVSGGVLQAAVGFGQFLRQGDFGLQVFGESVLSQSLKGIASFYSETGDKIIRAYGLTPHPNVLALILLMSLLALVFLFLTNTKRNVSILSGYSAAGAVLIFGLLSTFSRTTVALAGLLVLIAGATAFVNSAKQRRSDLVRIVFFVLVVGVCFALIFWPAIKSRMTISSDEDAVVLRGYYNRQALGSGSGWNLAGVGLGNFTEWLIKTHPGEETWRYQPVHNIFLLAYSETGILGSLMFLGFLSAVLVPALLKFLRFPELNAAVPILAACCLLFLGLFDHFSWTLQQGRIVWWGVLGALTIPCKMSK